MFEQIFKNIDDVLWKEAGCSSELDYTEQTLRRAPIRTTAFERRPMMVKRVSAG